MSAVISIPFLIIPKIQILLRKKIYLGCSLCLSTVLIIATIIRMPGLEYTPNPLRPPNIDTIWLVYWQFAELCLAVLMVRIITIPTDVFSSTFQPKRAPDTSRKRPGVVSIRESTRNALCVHMTTSNLESP